jgi:sensor histidine kinase YesM
VENAIRHGQARDGSVDLTIRVQPQAKAIIITIADRGPGMATNHRIGKGSGHGLRNVDERLRKTYGDGYGLGFAVNEPQGTVVTVKIPAGSEE